MAELYVATDDDGRQAHVDPPVVWPLPTDGDDGQVVPGATITGELELCEARGLLGRLDSHVRVAEAIGPEGAGGGGAHGTVTVGSARLVATTPWDGYLAAGFALDCAEHVLGDAGELVLPDGTPLATALERVRHWLASAESDETGRIRDLALGWRIKRQGKAIGDFAFLAYAADLGADVDALEEPVWTTAAAARDAALAAVEAVQHARMPVISEIEGDSYEAVDRRIEHGIGWHRHAPSAWVPFWVATDDAAQRARQAARASGGEPAEEAEEAWQAQRLAELLRGEPADEGPAADHR